MEGAEAAAAGASGMEEAATAQEVRKREVERQRLCHLNRARQLERRQLGRPGSWETLEEKIEETKGIWDEQGEEEIEETEGIWDEQGEREEVERQRGGTSYVSPLTLPITYQLLEPREVERQRANARHVIPSAYQLFSTLLVMFILFQWMAKGIQQVSATEMVESRGKATEMVESRGKAAEMAEEFASTLLPRSSEETMTATAATAKIDLEPWRHWPPPTPPPTTAAPQMWLEVFPDLRSPVTTTPRIVFSKVPWDIPEERTAYNATEWQPPEILGEEVTATPPIADWNDQTKKWVRHGPRPPQPCQEYYVKQCDKGTRFPPPRTETKWAPGSIDLDRRRKRGAALSNLEKMFMAYDCTIPANMTTAARAKTLRCDKPPTAVRKDEKTYLLMQRATYTRFPVYACDVKQNRISYICGGAGHSSIHPSDWYFNRPVAIPNSACLRAWREGQWHMLGNLGKMGIVQNGTSYRSIHKAGRTWTDGTDVNCKGEWANFTKVMGSGNNRYYGSKSMVVNLHFEFTINQLTGMVDLEGKVTILEDQIHLPCPVEKRGCAVSQKGHRTYAWEPPTELQTCPYYKVRNVTGIDVTDQEGHVIFMSRDASMVRLMKGSPLSRCGGVMYATDYDNLFLTEELDHPSFLRGLHPSEMSVITYANQQDGFLFGKVNENIQTEAIAVHREQCEKEGRRRGRDYARQAAEQHAVKDGETAHLGNGRFVTAAGEAWYRYQCRQTKVQGRETNDCYNALPVRLSSEDLFLYAIAQGIPKEEALFISESGGLKGVEKEVLEQVPGLTNEFYLEPRSRRIVTTASVTTCAPPFSIMYENTRGRWIAHEGERFFMAAEPLLLDVEESSTRRVETMHEHLNFQQGGIYDSASVRRMDKFSQAARAIQGIASKLTRQQSGGTRPYEAISASSLFSDLSRINLDALDVFSWFWSALEKYGQLCSIIVVVGLFIRILYWMAEVITRLYSAPTHPNMLVHVLTAFLPAAREYFGSHKNPHARYPQFRCLGCCLPGIQRAGLDQGPITRRQQRIHYEEESWRDRHRHQRRSPPRRLGSDYDRNENSYQESKLNRKLVPPPAAPLLETTERSQEG
jgi:hypothetical protein